MLKANLERQSIEFSRTFESEAHQVYIVAVGTPLGENSKPDLTLLKNALEAISKNLKKGNQTPSEKGMQLLAKPSKPGSYWPFFSIPTGPTSHLEIWKKYLPASIVSKSLIR